MSFILAVNAGSSSLKVSLYQRVLKNPATPCLLLTFTTTSISSPPATVTFRHANTSQARLHVSEPSIRDQESAFVYFLDRLKETVSIDPKQIKHICHRVVHGGDYTEPTVVSEQSYHHIEILSDLAPLRVPFNSSQASSRLIRFLDRHNGAALSVMSACLKALPHASSIAFFDTAFHKNLPRHVSTYAIDQKIARERALRKYGFHGLSCKSPSLGRRIRILTVDRSDAFIRRVVADHLHKNEDELDIIALHLGSGASACAIRGGKSVDTSMGLTPLSGMPGATRTGDVDPTLIFHYTNEPSSRSSHHPATSKQTHVQTAEHVLNTQAGWKALAGTTDFGEITRKADLSASAPPLAAADDPYTLAFHVVLDRVLHYVGAYHLSLRGKVDALVFAGGIGEGSRELRSAVGEAAGCLGYSAVDEHVNQALDRCEGVVIDIGKDDGGKRMLVCRTDEQFEMARACSLTDEFWV